MVRKKGRRNKKSRRFKKNVFEIFIEFVVLIYLIPLFFSLSLIAGFAYLFAVFSIFYNGTLFKKKGIARLVVFGSILTYLAGYLLLYSYNTMDGLVFLFVVALSIFVWFKGRRMKKGK